MKMWKVYRQTDRRTDIQTTDNRWSEKLTWAFSSDELKTIKQLSIDLQPMTSKWRTDPSWPTWALVSLSSAFFSFLWMLFISFINILFSSAKYKMHHTLFNSTLDYSQQYTALETIWKKYLFLFVNQQYLSLNKVWLFISPCDLFSFINYQKEDALCAAMIMAEGWGRKLCN